MTIWTCLPTPLRAGDVGLAAGAAIGCALAARAAGPCAQTSEDVFLADRRVSWWAAGAALFSSEVTALTFLAVPAAAYAGGWGLLHLFAGSLAGRAASGWLAPRQRAAGALTVYGAARARAGAAAAAGAAAFCAARVLSCALRLAAGALALSLLSGLGPGWCLVALCAAGAAVAGYGGLRGVVWTAGVQAGVVLLAAAALPLYTVHQVPGALHGVWAAAGEAGRLTLSDAGPIWRAWLLGAVGAAAGFSADHELAQKLLCCRSDGDARRALAVSAAASAVLLLLLLASGSCLLAFYHAHPALAVPDRLDKIVPYFGATVLPAPLRGLLLAALFFAAMDVPVSSLSAAAWADLASGGPRLTARARWALAGGWSAVLLALGLWMLSSQAGAAWGALAWPAAGGAVLALLVGAALKRPGEAVSAAALTAGVAAALALARLGAVQDPGWLTLAGLAAGAAVIWGAGAQ